MEIRVLSSSNVVAKQQQDGSKLEAAPIVLSPLDHLMGYASYQKRSLFFKQAPPDAVSLLKESLAKALEHFYPFAGRVSLTQDNVLLQLHTNNAGVTFLEAETDATIADLGDFLPSEFCDSLCQMEMFPQWPWKTEYPLFTVQVTAFACGGLSVGVCFSHQVCDGPSFWYFINSWSEIARTGGLQLQPVTSFKIPLGDISPEDREKHREKLSFTLVERELMFGLVRKMGWKGKDEVATQKMKFTVKDLADLKSKAPGMTSFEVLTAYLWQRLAKSWDQPGSECTTLYVLVNCRHRLEALAKCYIGNAVIPTGAHSTVEELAQAPLGRAAGLVHRAIGLCTKESVEGVVSYMYENLGNKTHVPMVEPSPGTRVLIVSSPRHPVYETDFGWGRPAGSSFGANDLGHGKIYLFPSAQGDGTIDVTVALNKESMDIFVQDREFLA